MNTDVQTLWNPSCVIPCETRAEWLAVRRRGLGGSDAAAAVGLSPWRSPLDVYLDKIGASDDDEPTEAMRWGTALEPAIRQRYADDCGERILRPRGIVRHPRFEWMLASVDGVTESGKLLEVKTARTGQGWEDGIPEHYALQVQHYLAVLSLDVADVAVLIGGQDYRVIPVEADAELQSLLIEREEEFWRSILAHTPPAPTTTEQARKLFRRSTPKRAVAADDDTLALAIRLAAWQEKLDEADAEVDALRAAIMGRMGDAETLTDAAGKVLATWKSSSPSIGFDLKRFRAEQPELAKQYDVAKDGARRFLFKGDKKGE